MGWTGIVLEGEWKLFTRGGLKGIFITNGEIEIKIPEKLLLNLAAEQIQNNRISALEQMKTDEILNQAGLTAMINSN